MNMINNILISIFLSCVVDINAQCQMHVDTISFRYYNGITSQIQIIDNYQITNNTNEEYLTWVSLTSKNDKSNIELIWDYFMRRKGDYSLMEMICENLLSRQQFSMGYSFVKNIAVGETFSYYIVKTDSSSTYYQDRIVVMRRCEVEQYLRDNLDKVCLFKYDSIVLVEK